MKNESYILSNLVICSYEFPLEAEEDRRSVSMISPKLPVIM